MEQIAALMVPALMSVVLVRTLLLPIHVAAKFLAHSASGFICLWLMNLVAPFTGIYFPLNAVTVLTVGFLGLPGIGFLALLAVI